MLPPPFQVGTEARLLVKREYACCNIVVSLQTFLCIYMYPPAFMQLESKPEIIDKLERRVLTMKIEMSAIKKEAASNMGACVFAASLCLLVNRK